jgi:hypothetical protein
MRGSQDAGLIEVSVGEPEQLFERLDPTPAADRHLEEKVEQFVLHQAEEDPRAEYRLIVRFREPADSGIDETALAEAIRHHFRHRRDEESARLRGLVRDGKRDVMVGLLFLFVCGVLGVSAFRIFPAAIGIFVEQGLLILGWVALWRPADLFLYDLRPIRRRRDLLDALSVMDVSFA